MKDRGQNIVGYIFWWRERHEGAFWDAGNFLYVDLNGIYTDVYICKNVSTTHLKFAGLVYASYISIKKQKFIGDKPLKR